MHVARHRPARCVDGREARSAGPDLWLPRGRPETRRQARAGAAELFGLRRAAGRVQRRGERHHRGRRLGYWWGPGRIRPLVLNGALAVVLFRRSKLRRLAEGTPRTLISMGVVDHEALRKERVTEDQLMAVIVTQGAGGLDEVAEAVLLPQG